ncbi:hypothetical protein [Tepidimonas fonticaldi]|uniref:hypothetical protein n=1 Tax=Tepidimonas fonticaldi TaxID=1101373 RepID=UPI00117D8A99|nr:hypothetical protein [Tepidimonas fonticaldi]
MSIYVLRSVALAVAVAATLAACGKQSSSSRDSSADVQACRGEVERAVHQPGQSDTEAYRAAENALDACMKRKGY